MKAFFFALVLLYSLSGVAGLKSFTYSRFNEDCTVSFDPKKVTEQELLNAVELVFVISNQSLNFLSLCNTNINKEYKECGNRNFGEANYLYNANVNLEENEKKIKRIEGLAIPKELEPSRVEVLEEMNFYKWLHNTIFKYLTSRDISLLKETKYKHVNSKTCESHFNQLTATTEPEAVSKAVQHSWYKCMNSQWRDKKPSLEHERLWKRMNLKESCVIDF